MPRSSQLKKRISLFEFEDQRWFPDLLRAGMMDYLRYMSDLLGFYQPSTSILLGLIKTTGNKEIIEVCSGSCGALGVWEELDDQLKSKTSIIITDIYPNKSSILEINTKNFKSINIQYLDDSVDALAIPNLYNGIRVMFSAFHHFDPFQAKKFLTDAAEKKIPIAIFDAGTNNILLLLLMLFLHPIFFFFCTPFIKPLSFKRFIFTYLIPLIPLCTIWDGSVSILRFYRVSQIKELVSNINPKDYQFTIGSARNKIGIKMNYVIGMSII